MSLHAKNIGELKRQYEDYAVDIDNYASNGMRLSDIEDKLSVTTLKRYEYMMDAPTKRSVQEDLQNPSLTSTAILNKYISRIEQIGGRKAGGIIEQERRRLINDTPDQRIQNAYGMDALIKRSEELNPSPISVVPKDPSVSADILQKFVKGAAEIPGIAVESLGSVAEGGVRSLDNFFQSGNRENIRAKMLSREGVPPIGKWLKDTRGSYRYGDDQSPVLIKAYEDAHKSQLDDIDRALNLTKPRSQRGNPIVQATKDIQEVGADLKTTLGDLAGEVVDKGLDLVGIARDTKSDKPDYHKKMSVLPITDPTKIEYLIRQGISAIPQVTADLLLMKTSAAASMSNLFSRMYKGAYDSLYAKKIAEGYSDQESAEIAMEHGATSALVQSVIEKSQLGRILRSGKAIGKGDIAKGVREIGKNISQEAAQKAVDIASEKYFDPDEAFKPTIADMKAIAEEAIMAIPMSGIGGAVGGIKLASDTIQRGSKVIAKKAKSKVIEPIERATGKVAEAKDRTQSLLKATTDKIIKAKGKVVEAKDKAISRLKSGEMIADVIIDVENKAKSLSKAIVEKKVTFNQAIDQLTQGKDAVSTIKKSIKKRVESLLESDTLSALKKRVKKFKIKVDNSRSNIAKTIALAEQEYRDKKSAGAAKPDLSIAITKEVVSEKGDEQNETKHEANEWWREKVRAKRREREVSNESHSVQGVENVAVIGKEESVVEIPAADIPKIALPTAAYGKFNLTKLKDLARERAIPHNQNRAKLIKELSIPMKSDYRKMKLRDLKKVATAKGISGSKMSKAVIVTRLFKADRDATPLKKIGSETSSAFETNEGLLKAIDEIKGKFKGARGIDFKISNEDKGKTLAETDEGSITFYKKNLTPDNLLSTFIHEDFGHTMIKGLLGKKGHDKLIKNMIESVRYDDKLTGIMTDIRSKYKDIDRDTLVDEMIAHYAEKVDTGKLKKFGFWGKAIRAIRDRINAFAKGKPVSAMQVRNAIKDSMSKYMNEDIDRKGLYTGGEASYINEAKDVADQVTGITSDALKGAIRGDKESINTLKEAYKVSKLGSVKRIGESLQSGNEADLGAIEQFAKLPEFLRKDHKEFGTFIDIASNRASAVSNKKMALFEKLEPYTNLKDKTKVNKALIRLDKDPDGKTSELNEEERVAYNSVRATLDNIQDEMVDRIRDEIAMVGDMITSAKTEAGLDKVTVASMFSMHSEGSKSVPESLGKLIESHNRLRRTLEKLRAIVNYFPRVRGDGYHVQYISKDQAYRVRFPNTKLGKREADELADKHEDAIIDHVVNQVDGISGEVSYAEIVSRVEEAGSKLSKKDKESLLKEIKQDILVRGFGKHMIRREEIAIKGKDGELKKVVVEGYEEKDLGGVLGAYVSSYVASAEKQKAAKAYSELLLGIDRPSKPRLFKSLRIYIGDELSNRGTIDKWIGGAQASIFHFYMGARISSAMINLTQNYMLGVANAMRLRRKTGMSIGAQGSLEATKQMMSAQKDALAFMAGKKVKEGDLLSAWKAEAQMQTLTAEMGKTLSNPSTKIGKAISKTAMASGWLFQQSEINNRLTAKLFAHRMFEGNEDIADQFVIDTHFNYDSYNAPLIFKGPYKLMKPLVGGLSTYAWNFWNHIAANRSDSSMVGTMFFASMMLSGVPFEDFFKFLYEDFLIGKPRSFRKDLEDSIGNFGANVFQSGLIPSLAPDYVPDLSGSLSINMIPLVTSIRAFTDPNSMSSGAFQQMVSGIIGAASGRRDISKAMPLAMKNLSKAWGEYQNGLTTRSGKSISQSREKKVSTSFFEFFLRGVVGFRTLDRKNFDDRQWDARKLNQSINAMKKKGAKAFIKYQKSDPKGAIDSVRAINDHIIYLKKKYGVEYLRSNEIDENYITSRLKSIKAYE